MDLSRPVGYRGLALNSASVAPGGKKTGILLERCEPAPVQGVGYREKRAQGDGMDASDVYLGGRRLSLSGTVYGLTRAAAFDTLQHLRAAFMPTSAYAAAPGDRGYMPLSYQEPTEDIDKFPTGYRDLFIKVRAVSTVACPFIRDRLGGEATGGLGIPWGVEVEAIDPRVYVYPEVTLTLAENGTSGSGDVGNRGDYPAPVNILLFIPAARSAGSMTLNIGGAQMVIAIPEATADQTIRYDGYAKVLTIETNGVESLRQDCLSFLNSTSHPAIQPGVSAWSWTSTVAMGAGGRIWFNEAFA